MDMEDSAGGARKATKSKLFEFLVHGVVSEFVSICLCVHVEACESWDAAVLILISVL